MSEPNERFYDPSDLTRKAGLNEDGPEVEGHKAARNEDIGDVDDAKAGKAGKAGMNEDDGPEVEGHAYRGPEAVRDAQGVRKAY